MPGSPTRYSIPTMAGADGINTIDEWTVSAMGDVDALLAPSDQGSLASRPASTGGSPSGKAGRTYFATDTGALYRDNGTGWDLILTGAAGAVALGMNAEGVVRRGKSIIATTESRSSSSYGPLTTPDRVQSVALPTDGLLFVAYQAVWQNSVTNAARAAIFVGANQAKIAPAMSSEGTAPIGVEVFGPGTVNTDYALSTWSGGLINEADNSAAAYTGDVTTGQIVGTSDSRAGVCCIFAVAGTYDVSVQFKASSGSVTVKNRKLWVWTVGF